MKNGSILDAKHARQKIHAAKRVLLARSARLMQSFLKSKPKK